MNNYDLFYSEVKGLIDQKLNTLPNNAAFWQTKDILLWKTLWEKEKLLVTSNFSFSHNGFYPMWHLFLAHLSTTCSRGAFRVVMYPSCIVNNFFKHLLLLNHWANLDQTWQECSLGGPLQKLFTEFDSIKNAGCHGNEIKNFKQFFKKSPPLVRFWNNFIGMFLGWPFLKSVCGILIGPKTWLWWMGASCTIRTWRNS